jgi:hypothetical protein
MPSIQLQYVNIKNNGVFSTTMIPKNTNLGPGFIKVKKTGDPKIDIAETKLGKYIKHSNDPNLFIKISRWKFYLFTRRDIKIGEELTLNHTMLPWKLI